MKITLTLLLLLSATFVVNAQTWVAPKSADTIENPFIGNKDAIKKGKKLFASMCVICHGFKGKGDGVAGAALSPKPANFTSKTIQAQTDGALFWKLTNGKAPMAAYKDMLTKEQRWQLVNYLRTFKK
ncbi:MAG: cytochrome c [Chlorobi bacterium]|nr:cytochrome c [Chlorobiota bacterium]